MGRDFWQPAFSAWPPSQSAFLPGGFSGSLFFLRFRVVILVVIDLFGRVSRSPALPPGAFAGVRLWRLFFLRRTLPSQSFARQPFGVPRALAFFGVLASDSFAWPQRVDFSFRGPVAFWRTVPPRPTFLFFTRRLFGALVRRWPLLVWRPLPGMTLASPPSFFCCCPRCLLPSAFPMWAFPSWKSFQAPAGLGLCFFFVLLWQQALFQKATKSTGSLFNDDLIRKGAGPRIYGVFGHRRSKNLL